MSTLDEKITFPGVVTIDRLRLYNKNDDHIDLTLGQATEILIYESMFAPCMFGSLTMADADAIIDADTNVDIDADVDRHVDIEINVDVDVDIGVDIDAYGDILA